MSWSLMAVEKLRKLLARVFTYQEISTFIVDREKISAFFLSAFGTFSFSFLFYLSLVIENSLLRNCFLNDPFLASPTRKSFHLCVRESTHAIAIQMQVSYAEAFLCLEWQPEVEGFFLVACHRSFVCSVQVKMRNQSLTNELADVKTSQEQLRSPPEAVLETKSLACKFPIS